jgi:hypothetical protein
MVSRWALGLGAVAAGRDIRGPVTITVQPGAFDRLRDAIFDPRPLAQTLDLTRFTGRQWLIDRIDGYMSSHTKGYVVVQGEAGVGRAELVNPFETVDIGNRRATLRLRGRGPGEGVSEAVSVAGRTSRVVVTPRAPGHRRTGRR